MAILNNLARLALARRDTLGLRRSLHESISVAREMCDPRLLMEWFEIAARLRSLEGQPVECATAVGAAIVLRDRVGQPNDVERVPDEELLDAARLRVSRDAWARAVESGETEAGEDPIQVALGLQQRIASASV
jgi:hypothetical protein